MTSGGKRGSAGERVLESRHVIGLFMLMLLFSGVFFTLGYVMGRNEYDGQVRAATNLRGKPENSVLPKLEPAAKRANGSTPVDAPTDTTAPPNSDWEFYHAGENKKTEDHLKPVAAPPVPAQKNTAAFVKTKAPLIARGAYTVQVAALKKEADALELANRLQKKKFPAFVLSPQTDKYYRVRLGPYADERAADAARKGLEGAGFKAIVKH